MASPAPAKSQSLHNFSLPQFQWRKDHTSNHRRARRPADSSPPADSAQRKSPTLDSAARRQSPTSDSAARRQSPLLDSAPRQSPMRDSASDSESGYVSENRKNSPPESGKNGLLVSSDNKIEKSEKNPAASDVDIAGVKEVKSKIYIRLRTKNKPDDVQEEGKTGTEEGEVEESVAKTWNLRPRKPIRKPANANGGPSKVGGAPLQENKVQLQQVTTNRPESVRLRCGPEAEAAEKKGKKQKFSISLSRHEIEEDFFALTGSKPARRPKKRVKPLQKQLENLLPGMWLASITPDSYKVSEAPAKG